MMARRDKEVSVASSCHFLANEKSQTVIPRVARAQKSAIYKVLRDTKITQIYEGTNQVQRIMSTGQMLR